jgi:hypothetical protein
MKPRCYIFIFLLSFSWLLSFQENHLCSEDSSAAPQLSEVEDHGHLTHEEAPSSGSEHDKEMCHFGHCSHGIGATQGQLSLPLVLSTPTLFSAYNLRCLAGISGFNLRPPALA